MAQFKTLTFLTLSLLIAPANAAEPEPNEPNEPVEQKQSSFREDPDTELVEITIRLPDGRVIKRKEPRIASKIDPRAAGVDGETPPIVRKRLTESGSQSVNKTKTGVTGGSNSSSVKTSGGGGGGGGGSSSSSGGGGGGGGGSSDRGSSNGSGGSAGGSSGDLISPVQPDTDFTVRMYAWDNTGPQFQNIQEAVVVDPRSLSPVQLAERVANAVNAQRSDKTVLRFWKEFFPASRHPFDISDARELINSGGFTSELTAYWGTFAQELKARGITPDYMIFDQEEGISFWHVPVSQRRRFFGELLNPEQQHLSALPPSMQGMRVEQFLNYRAPDTIQAFNDYNLYATEFRAALIRRIFHDTFQQAYGDSIPMSNYGDFIEGFTVYTHHNREIDAATVAGISAPVAYLDHRGDDAPRYARRSKDQRWNRMIDQLNEVRSSAQPGLTTPWIAPPGYGRFGANTWARSSQLDEELALWETHMQHMLAMGVDTFILWNPSPRFNPNARVADEMMDNWLAENPRVNSPQLRSLPAIPLDAEYIETNGVVTTYQQFLEMMNLNE